MDDTADEKQPRQVPPWMFMGHFAQDAFGFFM